ncbi:unnamed protein product, partial [Didymodactylos carnosus]
MSNHQPQPRWNKIKNLAIDDNNVYIGFHRTKAEDGISIAHSEFKISQKKGRTMLGHGVYFARSIDMTMIKAVHKAAGAIICAEIRMGYVKEVERTQ